MGVVIMELNNNWKWIVLIELQGQLQNTPFFIVIVWQILIPIQVSYIMVEIWKLVFTEIL
jgi:hypothetical protein